MYKLKQCPFCGGKNIDIYITGNKDKKYAQAEKRQSRQQQTNGIKDAKMRGL